WHWCDDGVCRWASGSTVDPQRRRGVVASAGVEPLTCIAVQFGCSDALWKGAL
ncbi:hypothetical protein Pmar_PMAR025553, partial [Perkinsus marinus ATCC 50983]